MLDLRNLFVAMQARYPLTHQEQKDTPLTPTRRESSNEASSDTDLNRSSNELGSLSVPRVIRPIDLSSRKAVIFLQDMINVTIALKSNLEVDVVQPSSQWPHSLFQSNSIPISCADIPASEVPPNEGSNAVHVAQAISGLQREILLLRNDLNFELWLSRENAKNIGRLYEERVLMKSTEAERQGLVIPACSFILAESELKRVVITVQ